MANKYVRCDSHCKYPAYDKNEVDELFYKKENFAVITGVTTRNTISYPEGFNFNNCVVIGASFLMGAYWISSIVKIEVNFETQEVIENNRVILSPSGIMIGYENAPEEINYKIVLMKVGE